jgi:hypothetical protein
MPMSAETAPVAGPQKEIQPKVFICSSVNDQNYRKRFQTLFGKLYEIDSVAQGDVGTDSGTEYIQRLIQENHIGIRTVLVVLVGKDTWGRKHIDWEISAALTKKTDGYSGLMGLCLPTHPAFRTIQYKTEIVPQRLVDNIKTGYARFYDWSETEGDIRSWIKDAFQARITRAEKIDNSRPLYTDSWSTYANWAPHAPEIELISAEETVDPWETAENTNEIHDTNEKNKKKDKSKKK